MILETDGLGSIGELLIPGFVPRYTEAPSRVRWQGPRVGEHTAAVLGSELGLSEEELAGLSASGVIGLDPGLVPAR